jgi:type II secretory pathway component PulK
MHYQPKRADAARRGFVLLAVLIVVVLLSLAAYQFSDVMLAEYKANDSYLRSAQARSLAESGIQYAAALLSNPDAYTNTLNSNPYNNPSAFQRVVVNPSASQRFRGYFSIVSPLDPGDTGSQPFRFGVSDEGGKINLNAIMQTDPSGTALSNILNAMTPTVPTLTPQVIDPIIDWIDSDSTPRQNGAEDTYYQQQSPPYHAKNGPLDTLDELLLVMNMTPQILYGNDRNRNGILDPGEGDGAVDRGLSAYFTVHSREQNIDSQGNQRIYVNANDLKTLYQQLKPVVGDQLAKFIILYRTYGPSAGPSKGGASSKGGGAGSTTGSKGGSGGGASSSKGGGGGGASGKGGKAGSSTGEDGADEPDDQNAAGLGKVTPSFKVSKPQSIKSLFDLVNTYVQIPSANPRVKPTRYPSPLNDPATQQTLLPILLDAVSTSKALELPGRINVNTAPAAVLMGLTGLSANGLTETDVQTILANRPSPDSTEPPDPMFQTTAWLLTAGNISAKKLSSLDKYITARSQVYRVQSIGRLEGGGPAVRLEAVIDTNQGFPRILYRRELTELGKGFDLGPGAGGNNGMGR